MSRPYVLAETNWKTIREVEYQVGILPWGATEVHNLHLPYGTDTIQAESMAIAPRNWTQITTDTGVGDPTGATAEKGRIFLDAFTNEFADFLVQLSQADLDELYE
jgi:creatinine amidohydrolase/Fe(II)-dependent formamide hydrolase-like protein